MTSVMPCLGVLATLMCWAGAAQAPGLPAPGEGGGIYAGSHAPLRMDDEARNAVGMAERQFGSADLTLPARAYGVGAMSELAAAWNEALAANRPSLPGLFAPQTTEVRERFVDAKDGYLFFSVEQACLEVGCMTEFAFTPTGTETETVLDPQQASVVPVPPAMLLFGSALGLLAWRRRRPG